MILRPSRSTTIALLLSPVGLLLISATRLLIIADYNTTTASAIVSSGSYISTLLGTIIPLVPIFMPYLALMLLFFNRVVVSLLAFLAAGLVSPTQVTMAELISLAQAYWQLSLNWAAEHMVGVVILGIPFLIFLAADLIGIGIYGSIKTIATIASLAIVPFIFQVYPFPLTNSNSYYSDLLRQPWLPSEEVILKTGNTIIGYVLSANDQWIVILRARGRTIRYVPAGDVIQRRVCVIGTQGTAKPLLKLIATLPTVPTCSGTAPYFAVSEASGGRLVQS